MFTDQFSFLPQSHLIIFESVVYLSTFSFVCSLLACTIWNKVN